MTRKGGGRTINAGPTPKARDERKEFEIAGNARKRGEDISPDDRQRGETSKRDSDEKIRKSPS